MPPARYASYTRDPAATERVRPLTPWLGLSSEDDERAEPRGPMLEAIIEALIAQDIVDPITTHIA